MPTLDLSAWAETFETGGPIMILMLLTSVVIVALALARFWVVGSAWMAVRHVDRRVLGAIRKGQWEDARKAAASAGSPIREIFLAGIDRVLGQVKGEPAMAMAREQKRAMGLMKATVWMLGSTGALMPFVGLFGTVVGVMSSFQAIKDAGTGGVQIVSGGISEALVATAAGLFVALEAIVFFNIIQNMIVSVGRDLSLLIDELIEAALVREKSLDVRGGQDAERTGQ